MNMEDIKEMILQRSRWEGGKKGHIKRKRGKNKEDNSKNKKDKKPDLDYEVFQQ